MILYMIVIAMPPNTPVFNVFSYAPLRGSRAQRGLMRPSVFEQSGRFARDILEILKIGATPHADGEGEAQKHIGFPPFWHQTFKNTV